jgi:hypothetical protein
MSNFPDTEHLSESGASRRAVLKAAAWTAPVVALSVAAPAASASAGTVGDLILNMGFIKYNNGKFSAAASATSVYQWTGTDATGAENSNAVSWTDPYYTSIAPWETGTMTYTVTLANNKIGSVGITGNVTLIEPWKLSAWDSTTATVYSPTPPNTGTTVNTAPPLGAVRLDSISPNNSITAKDGRVWTVVAISSAGYDSTNGQNASCTITFTAPSYNVTGTSSTIYMPRVGFRITYTLAAAQDTPMNLYSTWKGDIAVARHSGLNYAVGPIAL